MSAVRKCRVSLRDLQGTTHSIEVKAATLFEAAAAAVALFRQEGWGAEALTANAMIRVEVLLPPVVHDVPLKALERWVQGSSASPREQAIKTRLR